MLRSADPSSLGMMQVGVGSAARAWGAWSALGALCPDRRDMSTEHYAAPVRGEGEVRVARAWS
jgi:hypothetical protein